MLWSKRKNLVLNPQSSASLKQPRGGAVFVRAGLTCCPHAMQGQERRMSELPALCQRALRLQDLTA